MNVFCKMTSFTVFGILAILALSGVESLQKPIVTETNNKALEKVLSSIRQTRSASPDCGQANWNGNGIGNGIGNENPKPMYLIPVQPQQPIQALPPSFQPMQPIDINLHMDEHYKIHQQFLEEARRRQEAWKNEMNAANHSPFIYQPPVVNPPVVKPPAVNPNCGNNPAPAPVEYQTLPPVNPNINNNMEYVTDRAPCNSPCCMEPVNPNGCGTPNNDNTAGSPYQCNPTE